MQQEKYLFIVFRWNVTGLCNFFSYSIHQMTDVCNVVPGIIDRLCPAGPSGRGAAGRRGAVKVKVAGVEVTQL